MKSLIIILLSLIVVTNGTLQSVLSNENQEIAPCTIVVFEATGDLTSSKLFPAIYNLAYDANLSPHTAVVGFARGQHTDETFRKQMSKAIDQFSRIKIKDVSFQSDFEQDQGYENLKNLLSNMDQELNTQGNRIYYLATPPSHFSIIIKKLQELGLIYRPCCINLL